MKKGKSTPPARTSRITGGSGAAIGTKVPSKVKDPPRGTSPTVNSIRKSDPIRKGLQEETLELVQVDDTIPGCVASVPKKLSVRCPPGDRSVGVVGLELLKKGSPVLSVEKERGTVSVVSKFMAPAVNPVPLMNSKSAKSIPPVCVNVPVKFGSFPERRTNKVPPPPSLALGSDILSASAEEDHSPRRIRTTQQRKIFTGVPPHTNTCEKRRFSCAIKLPNNG